MVVYANNFQRITVFECIISKLHQALRPRETKAKAQFMFLERIRYWHERSG